jgi:eukaryotic-like serine/threonine-protein kinase
VLENVTSGTGKQISVAALFGRPHRRTRATIALAVVIAVAGVLVALRGLGVWPATSLFATGALARNERILVGDFRSSGSDTALASVVTEAFRISLAQSRNVGVMPPTGMRDALRRMQRDVNTRVEGGVAHEMATRQGLKAYVDGEILSAGGRYVISARLMETSTGEALVTLREQADDDRGVLPAVDRLTRGLRARAGDSFTQLRDALPIEQVTTPSLEAFRAYVQGARAFNYDADFERGRRLLERAISLDTGFAMAYRKLATELGNLIREPDLRIRYTTKAYQHRDRLTEVERYLVIGTYFERGPEADNEKAIEAYEAASEIQPTNTTALNNLATQLRRTHRFREAQRYTERVIQLPDVVLHSFNGYANNALFLGDTALARRVLAETERRFGRVAVVVEKRAEVLYALGDVDSALAAAYRLADMQVDGVNRSSGMRLAAGMLAAHGRVREASRALARAAALRALADTVPLMPAIDSAWVSIALRSDTASGRRILDRALAGHPVASISHVSRLYTALGTLLADAGRVDELKQLEALFERDSRTLRSIYDEETRQGLAGDIALAELRYADAARAYHQAGMAVSDCFVCFWSLEAHAYDLAGQRDSAIALFTRYLEQPDAWRSGDPYVHSQMADGTWLAHAYVRLGELWEAKGDRVKAASYYGRFVELWKDADPELQPKVADVRRRIERLRA